MLDVPENALILFQGDSITDAFRDYNDPKALGTGYAHFIAGWLAALYPEKNLRFLNRGISGNRVRDLEKRWDTDCLDLKPDWLSILIGINDTWRRYDNGQETSAADFEATYRRILEKTVATLEVKLIICEPFLLPVPEDRIQWREDLDPKIAVVRQLAREFNAAYVPLDGIFAAASTRQTMPYWLPDGVHPSNAGHALIAEHWLKVIGAR